MMRILLLATILFASCSSSKKDNAATVNNSAENSALPAKNERDKLPPCIKKMIDSFKVEAVQNPPRSIYSYTYQDKTVYYISPVCCDNFSDLLDSDCRLISHPDGGFTGRGDGKTPDFRASRTNEKLVWADTRR